MTAPIQLLTLRQVAAAFQFSERTLRGHLKRLGYPKAGGRWRFTSAEMNALYEAIKCPSNSRNDPAGSTGICPAPSAASTSAKLRALLTERRQKRSASNAKTNSSNVVSMAPRQPPPSAKPR